MSSSTTPTVTFIDDTDLNIKYVGPWQALTVTSANNTFIPTPLYGTVHALNNATGSISYTFQGTSIQAQFINNSPGANISCQVDGQTVPISIISGASYCDALASRQSSGSHSLFLNITKVSALDNSWSYFDGIFVTDKVGTTPGDITFNANILEVSQGTTEFSVDFDFTGYSLSAYLNFVATNGSNFDSKMNGSYTLDDQEPLEFTVNDPTSQSRPQVYTQLVIQTPRISLGEHHFHMDYSYQNISAAAEFIIVQNISVDPRLEVIPSIDPTLSSSNQPANHRISSHSRIIVGCSAGALVLLALLIGVLYWLRQYRRRVHKNMFQDNSTLHPVIRPFFLHSHLLLSLQYSPSEKPSRKAQILAEAEHSSRHTVTATEPGTDPERNSSIPRVQVRIHEDSGEAIAQPHEDDDVGIVDLPPLYNTIGYPITNSASPTSIEQQAPP